jgi:hypothetical protein
MKEVTFTSGEIRRVGFRFESKVLRAVIPPAALGTYLLLVEDEPIYVGRSDTCVRTRLCMHGLGQVATHFVWEPAREAWQGFCLEAAWWHRRADWPMLLNAIHPAIPLGDERTCPFCDKRDEKGLAAILPIGEDRRHTQTESGPIPLEQSTHVGVER